MSYFIWRDGFVYNQQKRSICEHTLRYFIETYGVNTIDSEDKNIFFRFNSWSGDTAMKAIDIIFEYKPDIILSYSGCLFNYEYLYSDDCYIFRKFLEQDVEYRYIRYSFQFGSREYRSFRNFLDDYKPSLCVTTASIFISLFRNHFYKGITMFELMKHRFIDKK